MKTTNNRHSASSLPCPLRVTPAKASVAAVVLAAGLLALFAPSALALQTHVFSSSFGSQGPGAGEVSSPEGVAVNDATGEVYVADTGNARVDEFDSSGNFVRAWGWGVADGTTAALQICAATCHAGISGAGAGQFETPAFIAVDNSTGPSAGDVYVGDTGDNLVSKFTGSGALVGSWGSGGQLSGSSATNGPFGPLAGVTVDAGGNLWVYDQNGEMFESSQDGSFSQDWNSGRGVTPGGIDADSTGNVYVLTGGGNVEQFTATGTDVGSVNGDVSSPTGFAVDRSGNDVYMDNNGSLIYHYPASCDAGGNCTAADTFGSGDLTGALGLAVDTSSHTVYAADAGDQRLDVFSPATVPDVATGAASNLGQQPSATLNGTVNPDGIQLTDCHFDYGLSTSYGQTAACVPAPGSIPADSSVHQVSADIAGLTVGGTYHFRLVAGNASGSNHGADATFRITVPYPPRPTLAPCPNDQLRIAYGAHLPDCRAYEQVTPLEKNGAGVLNFDNFTQASSAGDGITFLESAGLPGGVAEQQQPTYLSTRGTDGWSTQGLLPPLSYGSTASVAGWSGDLSEVFDQASDNAGTSLSLRDSTDGSFQTVVPYSNVGTYYFDGAGGPTVFFDESTAPLTANAASGQDNLYAWDQATGAISLVGALADGSAPSGGSFAGPYDWVDANPTFGSSQPAQGSLGYVVQYEHAISSDGSSVFFTAGGTGQLYLRENPTGATATTVHVSASQKTNGTGPGGTDPNGPRPAAFMFAAPDGSKVLFTSAEELTNDATTGTADQGSDLYEYDVASRSLTDLAPDGSDPTGADVQGVLGMSDDGSYVYFVANGVLASGATPGTCNGSARPDEATGACNLYQWHAGTVTFIARLSANCGAGVCDVLDWNPYPGSGGGAASWLESSRVSANGHALLFAADEPLTGYDNDSAACNRSGAPIPCTELYRYSATSDRLTCVSCDPTGAVPAGSAALEVLVGSNGGEPAFPSPFLTRNLSASGDQVFFDSPDPLVPQDVNGVTDAYEWEADGTGSCDSTAQDGGCLYLLSTGTSPDPSYFGDASANGDDAFIFTSQPLVGQDQDQLYDIYDARVDGGLASQWPASSSPCSDTEGCAPAAPVPSLPSPGGTITFFSSGNAAAGASHNARVKVSKRAVHGSRFVLTIKVPGAGRISGSGREVQPARRAVHRGGSYELIVRLTSKARAALKRKHLIKITVHVDYTPANGRPSSVAVFLTARAR